MEDVVRFATADEFGNRGKGLRGVLSAERTRGVDGTDEIVLKLSGETLKKDERVIVSLPDEAAGRKVREYMVVSTATTGGSGARMTTAVCRNSVAELSRKYHVDIRCRGYTARKALERCLDGTRWEVGVVDAKAKTADISYYHQSADKSLADICSTYGCEVDACIELDGNRVARRVVNLTFPGAFDPVRRLEYRSGMTNLKRTVSADDVVTRLYAWGKGLPKEDGDGNETGGYTRKVGIASVNDGKAYVEDEDATNIFGVPGADGARQAAEGSYENGDIEDPAQLLELAKAELAKVSTPIVSYELEVRHVEGRTRVRCGDAVQVVDDGFDPPLRLVGRVLQTKEDIADSESAVQVSIGNVRRPLSWSNMDLR